MKKQRKQADWELLNASLREDLQRAEADKQGLRAQVRTLQANLGHVEAISKDRYWTLRRYEDGEFAIQHVLITDLVETHLKLQRLLGQLRTIGIDGTKVLDKMLLNVAGGAIDPVSSQRGYMTPHADKLREEELNPV